MIRQAAAYLFDPHLAQAVHIQHLARNIASGIARAGAHLGVFPVSAADLGLRIYAQQQRRQ